MQGLRRALRYARACAFVASGASRRARSLLDDTRAVVLMYHRILPADEAARRSVEPGMYVTPETFARHLAWLASSFSVLPLHEIVSRLDRKLSLPPGACAITFDDGWRDNHDYAGPELARRGVPATIFVVAERVGTEGDFWPDEVCRRIARLSSVDQRALLGRLDVSSRGDSIGALLEHMKELPDDARARLLDRIRSETSDSLAGERELLDWSECDQLARAGVDIEAHGATHAILTRIPPATIERELRSAREILREHGHGRRGLLAYPSGAYDERVQSVVRSAGYTAAFTTEPGFADTADDLLALPRVGLHDDVSRTRVEFLHRIRG